MGDTEFKNDLLSIIDNAGKKEFDESQIDIKRQCEEKLENAKQTAENRYNEIVRVSVEKMNATQGGDASQKKTAQRVMVSEHREKIKQRVICDVVEKIEKFTEGEDYDIFLRGVNEKIQRECAGSSVKVFICAKDENKCDIFKNENTEVLVDKNIKLGGVYAVCEKKRLKIDETFDSKLERETENFICKSGLAE